MNGGPDLRALRTVRRQPRESLRHHTLVALACGARYEGWRMTMSLKRRLSRVSAVVITAVSLFAMAAQVPATVAARVGRAHPTRPGAVAVDPARRGEGRGGV